MDAIRISFLKEYIRKHLELLVNIAASFDWLPEKKALYKMRHIFKDIQQIFNFDLQDMQQNPVLLMEFPRRYFGIIKVVSTSNEIKRRSSNFILLLILSNIMNKSTYKQWKWNDNIFMLSHLRISITIKR